jgi:glycosyltransferase involved in cell wall biosynthesis
MNNLPSVSVVIPVYNGGSDLEACLRALAVPSLAPLEIIVVDDGSIDASAETARRLGAKVLATGGREGPAKARNLGSAAAKGEVLLFLDADVVAFPDVIPRVASAFAADPELQALIGSYDDDPAHQDFLSQYKNLMHCFVHQTGREQASTFWSGCGAIRRDVFLRHSGFDESYGRPAIEDIELGYRIIQSGGRILLDKDLRVKHLKRWTFWKLIRTDVMDRGIPWTELILRDRQMPNDLNLQLSQRVSVALAFLCVGFALAMAIYWKGYVLTPLFALLLFVMGRYWLDGDGAPVGRGPFLWMTLGFGSLAVLAWTHHMLGLIPPVILGYVLLFLRHRYEIAEGRKAKMISTLMALYAMLTVLLIVTYLPGHALIGGLFLALFALVVLNNQFYLFLAARRGKAFALAAIPFHLLYHFYNGISFAAGFLRHNWRILRGKSGAASAER